MKRLLFVLAALTSSVAMLAGCNGDGKADGDMVGNPVTGGSSKFRISVSHLYAHKCIVSVVPSDKESIYFFDIIEKDYIKSDWGGDVAAYAQNYLNFCAEMVSLRNLVWDDVLSVGDDYHDYDGYNVNNGISMKGNTDYVVFAAGFDGGKVSGELTTFDFRTPPPVFSDSTFDIVYDNGFISIIPSDNLMPYFWDLDEADAYDAPDEIVVEFLELYYGDQFTGYIYYGPMLRADRGTFMKVGRKYTVVAFGYRGGLCTDVARLDIDFEGIDRTSYTTLTEDRTVSSVDFAAYRKYGDIYESGNCNYMMMFRNSQTREFVQFELQLDFSQGDISGTYPIEFPWTLESGKALGGTYDENYLAGTWWGIESENPEDGVAERAAADSGTLTVEHIEGDNYHIFSEFFDPKGNKVTFDYTGEFRLNGDYTRSVHGAKLDRRSRGVMCCDSRSVASESTMRLHKFPELGR